jgi:chemotaxis protein CheD
MERRVRIAEYATATAPATLVAIGLGSCVAIMLYDAKSCIGGLAHVLLPAATSVADATDRPGRCPSSAVPRMLDEMRALGANGAITGRLVGGASLFGKLLSPEGAGTIGLRNVEAARAALAAARIRVTGELVGGTVGRSVYFDVASGRLHVRSTREGDRVL